MFHDPLFTLAGMHHLNWPALEIIYTLKIATIRQSHTRHDHSSTSCHDGASNASAQRVVHRLPGHLKLFGDLGFGIPQIQQHQDLLYVIIR